MTERYIPESAVRELAEEMRANEYAAANDISGEGQAAAKAYQEAADRMALLATAAQQGAPSDADILHALMDCDDSARLIGGLVRDDADAAEVRRCVVGVVRYALERFAAPQSTPAPEPKRGEITDVFTEARSAIEGVEPEGLRRALEEYHDDLPHLGLDAAGERFADTVQTLLDARSAAAKTPLISVRLSMLERLCRDWRTDDEEYSVLIGVSDGEPVAFDAEYPGEGVYSLAAEGPEGSSPRPAAAEGVENKAAQIARDALDQAACPVNRPTWQKREQVRREIMRRALQRIGALATDSGEGQADG
jgi:hypothetical protein